MLCICYMSSVIQMHMYDYIITVHLKVWTVFLVVCSRLAQTIGTFTNTQILIILNLDSTVEVLQKFCKACNNYLKVLICFKIHLFMINFKICLAINLKTLFYHYYWLHVEVLNECRIL